MAYTTTAKQFFEQGAGDLLGSPVLGGLVGVYEFAIAGKDGGTWWVDFKARTVTSAPNPSVGVNGIVRAQDRDFMALIEGRMSAGDGLLTQRLELAGEMVALGRLVAALDSLRQPLA